jgi:PAS domain S-box-containing protein
MSVSDQAEPDRRRESSSGVVSIEKLLQDVSGLAVQGYGPDGTIRYWNAASEVAYGYSAAEAIGRNLVDLIIPPEMRDAVRQVIRNGAQTGVMPAAAELLLLHKDGSRVPVFSSHAVLRPEQGEPRLYCMDVDLREIKALEGQLRAINRSMLCFREDPDENIQQLTGLLGELLKGDCALYNGLVGDRLCTRASWNAPADLPRDSLAEGHVCTDVIRGNRVAPVVIRDLDTTPYARCDPTVSRYGLRTYLGYPVVVEGRTLGSLCVVFTRDFNPKPRELEIGGILAGAIGMEECRRQVRDQLFHAHKMEAIGRLAGGVAHDFNNLLTAMLGCAEIISRSVAEDNEAFSYVRELRRCVDRASVLTRQLLTFSRRERVNLEDIDLNEIVGGARTMLIRLLGDNTELVVRPDARPCHARADVHQIEQVLLNLAVNARDAMPEGGRIVIRTLAAPRPLCELPHLIEVRPDAAHGPYVALSVEDEGTGIPPALLPHIFEPFFSTKEFGRGTGLGLAIVHGIVLQHGGLIGIASEQGKGTAFHIYLPAGAVAKHPARPATAAADKTSYGTETLLLVEDDPSVRRLLGDHLQRSGYEVLSAETGPEALALARDHRGGIRLLVADVVMPEMNGKAVADAVRALIPRLPVLFITGYVPARIQSFGIDPHRERILYKPFSPQALAEEVRKMLDDATRDVRPARPAAAGRKANGSARAEPSP